MLFQQLNREDAEKVYIICKNTSGASLAANLPVYFETDAQSDGLCVSQMVTSGNTLFAGINDATLADDGYGLVQVYGYRASVVYCPQVSSYSAIPGTRLVGVAGAAYLGFGTALSGATTTDALLHTENDQFVIAMETIASADGKSSTGNIKCFIRAL
jgi:hypothetical protein